MASNSPQSFPQSFTATDKSTAPAPSVPSASTVAKRLSSELMALMMSSPPGISAFPSSDSDLTHWKGRIQGPEGTAYAGQTYAISLSFPPTYPFTPPTVKFESCCYHPNVDLQGTICLDILKENWSPMLTVSTILISLQSLLGEPNNRSPLNVEAADLWDDEVGFKRELNKYYVALAEEDEDDDEDDE